MERASLRPVPSRPQGPVVPAEAVRFATVELPGVDEAAAAAFALVALVGRPRSEVASASEFPPAAALSGEELADALTRARKALRRKLHPLPGSGWCERAERLISDRLDDALVDPGPARLDVHLANCDRCVEHERRLGQAQDALVSDFDKAHAPQKEPEEEEEPAPPEPEGSGVQPSLRVVDATALPGAPDPEALPEADVAEALPEGDGTEALPEADVAEALPEGGEADAMPAGDVAVARPEDGATGERAAPEAPQTVDGTAEELPARDSETVQEARPSPEPAPDAAPPTAPQPAAQPPAPQPAAPQGAPFRGARFVAPAPASWAPRPPVVSAPRLPATATPRPPAASTPSREDSAVSAPWPAPPPSETPAGPGAARPAAPSPSGPVPSAWASPPAPSYGPSHTPGYGPQPGAQRTAPWQSPTAHPAGLVPRPTVDTGDTWLSIGPLVTVLTATLVVLVLAALIAMG